MSRRLRRLAADRAGMTRRCAGRKRCSRDLPENRDLLLIAAISLRHLARIPKRWPCSIAWSSAQPRFSQMHQERGLCHVALKDAPRAIDALLRAVNINPALPTSWRMLEGVYRLTGDAANAATAAAHVATLQRPAARSGDRDLACSPMANLAPAEQIIRAFLLRHGDHPEAMRLLARIGIARDVLDDAETVAGGRAWRSRPTTGRRAMTMPRRWSSGTNTRSARAGRRKLLALEPAQSRTIARSAPPPPWAWASTTEAIALYRDMLDRRARLAGRASLAGARAEDGRTAAGSDRGLSRRGGGAARFRRRLLEPGQSQNLSLHRRRDRAHARRGSVRQRLRWWTALISALRSARRWRIAARSPNPGIYYERGNALKRAESRYRPEIIETNTRRADRDLHAGLLPAPRRLGRCAPRPDLHPRPAAVRLHPARADPRLPFPGRGHPGTCGHPEDGARAPGPRDPIWTIRAIRRRWRT